MHRARLLVLLLALTAPCRLRAQAHSRAIRPNMCPAVQGVLADRLAKGKKLNQLTAYDAPPGVLVTSSRREVRVKQVLDMLGALEMTGPPPAAAPVLVVQVHVIDSIERPIDQRQLLLELDDGSAIDLGSMNAFRLSKPGAKRVEQNLTARVAPMQFRAIVRAGVVQARLGDVEFRLSNDQLDDMRALYSVALCGGQ